jgi:hypothetical protein
VAGSIRRVAAHLFLAGSACALAFAAAAQDAQNQVQVALERATRTPLEIVWLQTELEAETWQLDRLLTAAPRGCARPGAPKEGCTVSERPVWRYVFGEHTPTESARLVISSRLPDAPFRTGRLSLTGTGRVFIVTPRADGPRTSRPPAGAVVLAAGSTVQLVDAAYPAIQIEVRAPLEEPLLLGNLVSADIATVLGLLVRQPGTVQAASARGVPGGRIALRSSDAELQLASAAAAPRQQPAIAAQRERRAPPTMTAALERLDFSGAAGAGEAWLGGGYAGAGARLEVARIGAAAGAILLADTAPGTQDTPPTTAQVSLVAEALETRGERSHGTALVLASVAAIDPAGLSRALERAAAQTVTAAADVRRDLSVPAAELSRLAAAIESRGERLAAPQGGIAETQTAQLAAALESRGGPSATTASAEIARMRAEVEAEIARDRERIAQALACARSTGAPGCPAEGAAPKLLRFSGA